jgi:hypothetical protein
VNANAQEISEDFEWLHKFLTERGITWEIGPSMRYDQFGNQYVELFLCGPVPYEAKTDELLVVFARSYEAAKTHYARILLEFLGENRHIVWRHEPTIEPQEQRQYKSLPPLYFVYSRLTAYRLKTPLPRTIT